MRGCVVLLILGFTSLKSSERIDIDTIQRLLPEGESIASLQKLPGGCTNNIVLCSSDSGKRYIYRSPKERLDRRCFATTCDITSQASNRGVSVPMYGTSINKQAMLMEYIEPVLWPTYEDNAQPYISTMLQLSKFHNVMRSSCICVPDLADTIPFSFIFNPQPPHYPLPDQYSQALCKVGQYAQALQPSFAEMATICHGDFHTGNVLLSRAEDQTLRPWIIDFDSANTGHPYFDIAKFGCKFAEDRRIALLQHYLGEEPRPEQSRQLRDMHALFLMVVAKLRLSKAFEIAKEKEIPLMSLHEMHEVVSAPDRTSFLTINDWLTDPRQRQLSALYALREFIQQQG